MDILDEVTQGILDRQAEYNFKRGKYRPAIKGYMKLLDIALKKKDEMYIAYYEERIGDCSDKLDHHGHKERIDDHERASEHYIAAANKYRKLGNHQKAGEVYEKGAKAFEELDDFKRAGEFYEKSGIMFKDVSDFFNASYAYHKAAEYYEKDDEHEKAAYTYQQSAICDLKIKDTAGASISFKKSAKSYEKSKQWKNAIDSYAASVEIDTVDRRYLDVADTHESIANSYYETSDMKNSVYYHLKAAELRATNNDKTNAALSYRHVGGIYQSEKEYDKAIIHYLQSAETYYSTDNVVQAATSYMKAGEACELKNDYKSAAVQYLNAAKAYKLGGEDATAAELYEKSGDIYSKAADETQDRGQAGELKLKAALAYSEIDIIQKAADTYNQYAHLMEAKGDNEKAMEGFNKAAEAFIKAGMLWDAAEAYVNRADYEKANELYEKYGEEREFEKDSYGAGIAYLESANCYRRIGRDSLMKVKLNKGLYHLARYVEESHEGGRESADDITLTGDAYRKMGECHQYLSEYNKAQLNYKKAQELYHKIQDKGRLNITRGLSLKLEGVKAIDHGEYDEAEKLLQQSQKLLTSEAESGDWKKEYSLILSENSAEAKELVEKIKLKPEITLEVDKRSYTFIDVSVILNMKLSNNGGHTMKDITFLQHLPEEIELMKLPEGMPELPPGDIIVSSIELTPRKEGFYRIKPIEVYYEDQKGHKYVKASNEASLEVVEKPPTDYKNYMKGVDIFNTYARSQEANQNWFQAGDGYRQMGELCGRFKTDDTVKQYHLKAIENYVKYIENEAAGGEADMTRIKRVGDAHWYIGESRRKRGELDEAEKSYGESVAVYNRCKQQELANRGNAFKLKVQATKAIETGDYEAAVGLLNESLSYFDKAVKSTSFDEETVKALEVNEDEAKSMLESIKWKPGLEVTVRSPDEVVVGKVVRFEVTIKNPLNSPLNTLKPVIKVAEGLEVVETLDVIDEVTARETVDRTFKVRAITPGDYSFKPLDVTFKDTAGKTFMKGSNEVRFTVSKGVGAPGGEAETEAYSVAESEVAQGEAPSVNLDFADFIKVRVLEEAEVSGVLSNDGKTEVLGVRFMVSPTSVVEVSGVPQVMHSLPAGAKEQITIKLKAVMEGSFKLKPVEVFYRDHQGKRFFKSSSEISVTAEKG